MKTSRLAALASISFLLPFTLHAQQWTPPTPAELSMTSIAEVPGADAVVLNREEIDDDDLHVQSHYMRIKVLTEKGLKYGDVEIGYDKRTDLAGYTIGEFYARTVQPDGSIVPFTGKGLDKVMEKDAVNSYTRRVYTLPAVRPGSIVEYRYTIRRDDHWFSSPHWSLQDDLFIRNEHFLWKPTDKELTTTTRGGRQNFTERLAWATSLPKKSDLVSLRLPTGKLKYEVTLKDIPPFENEQYMPPISSARYHVYFYYTPYADGAEYWKTEVGYWNSDTDKFTGSNSTVSAVARDATAGASTDEQKARRLYAFVMTLENTDFTRQRTSQEEKKQLRSADDVLRAKHGSANQIAMTYVALARAAGLKADSMYIADRSSLLLDINWQEIGQLTDVIAVVNYDGKDHYLDPGSRYMPFDHLEWDHTTTGGVRQDNKDAAHLFSLTPSENYKFSHTSRVGDLKIADDGRMTGLVTLTFDGNPALRWRHIALRNDEGELKEQLKKEVESMLPGGAEVTVESVSNIENGEAPLKVVTKVSGRVGSSVGSRVMLPSVLFENNRRARFPHEQRERGVYFPYSEFMQDAVRYTLPAGWTVESAPADQKAAFKNVAAYALTSQQAQNTVTLRRDLIIGDIYFPEEQYKDLRAFYNDFEAKDHSSIVIQRAPAATAASAAPDRR